jgi:hypothetical protein
VAGQGSAIIYSSSVFANFYYHIPLLEERLTATVAAAAISLPDSGKPQLEIQDVGTKF